MKKILILNGPNLNLLGRRQPHIYGTQTLDSIIDMLRHRFDDDPLAGVIEHVCSNHEGDLIDAIHSYGYDPDCMGIVINAGAYTHTSLALADAISAVPVPVIEVHLSNTAAREPMRHTSLIAPVCRGTITGLGPWSYTLAVEALCHIAADQP